MDRHVFSLRLGIKQGSLELKTFFKKTGTNDTHIHTCTHITKIRSCLQKGRNISSKKKSDWSGVFRTMY